MAELSNVVPIYDAHAARAARDAAIQQVDEAAREAWKLAAIEAIYWTALKRPEFTTDRVFYVLDKLGVTTHENRAMGPRMLKAQRDGWVENTGRTRKSVRELDHARPLTVWRSLIYEGKS